MPAVVHAHICTRCTFRLRLFHPSSIFCVCVCVRSRLFNPNDSNTAAYFCTYCTHHLYSLSLFIILYKLRNQFICLLSFFFFFLKSTWCQADPKSHYNAWCVLPSFPLIFFSIFFFPPITKNQQTCFSILCVGKTFCVFEWKGDDFRGLIFIKQLFSAQIWLWCSETEGNGFESSF